MEHHSRTINRITKNYDRELNNREMIVAKIKKDMAKLVIDHDQLTQMHAETNTKYFSHTK